MCGANIETADKCGKGNTTETEHVESWNGEKCCYWKNWGEWSALEATCGSTTRTRIRDCLCGNEINSIDKCGNEKNTEFQLVKKEVCPIGPLAIPGENNSFLPYINYKIATLGSILDSQLS